MTKAGGEAKDLIEVNRAPVLTLWATIVARRTGYKQDEALTLGRAVAGLNAQPKGRRLGIYEPTEKSEKKPDREDDRVEVCGRVVPVEQTDEGVRAVVGGTRIDPKGVQGYLERTFGDDLGVVQEAMTRLAKSYGPKELETAAYGLYEQFRPAIPGGKRGWGAKGGLDLKLIKSLSKRT